MNMKNNVKFLLGGFALCAVGAVAGLEKLMNPYEMDDELLLSNVEALSDGENSSGFDCVLTKDECKFIIKSDAELSIMQKILKTGALSIGMEVDLTDATKIYREKCFWESGVRCGTDVTCNDLVNDLVK